MCFSGGGGSSNVKPAPYSTEDGYKQVTMTTEKVPDKTLPTDVPLQAELKQAPVTGLQSGGLNSNLM